MNQCCGAIAAPRCANLLRAGVDAGTGGTAMLVLLRHRRKSTTAAIMVLAAMLAGAGAARAEEKGPPVEFWKGHFARDAQAFHDWDSQKEIPAVCSRCHGANKLPE